MTRLIFSYSYTSVGQTWWKHANIYWYLARRMILFTFICRWKICKSDVFYLSSRLCKSLCVYFQSLRNKLFVLNVTIMMFAIPIIHRFAPLHHQLYNYYAISVKFTTVRVVAFGTLCHGIYMKAQLSWCWAIYKQYYVTLCAWLCQQQDQYCKHCVHFVYVFKLLYSCAQHYI